MNYSISGRSNTGKVVQKKGPWTIENSTEQYQDSFIKVVEDRVIRPDGEPGTYSTVAMKPGVAILPIDEDQNVYLVRQFRYALGKESLEVVSGALESDESALEAAQRELKEEVEIRAKDWQNLGMFDLDTSIVQCPVHLFVVKQLDFGESDREGSEAMETCKMPLQEAFTMIMESKITHAPSCVLLLKSQAISR